MLRNSLDFVIDFSKSCRCKDQTKMVSSSRKSEWKNIGLLENSFAAKQFVLEALLLTVGVHLAVADWRNLKNS